MSKSACAREMLTPGFSFTSDWSQELLRALRRSPPLISAACIIVGTHASRLRNASLPRNPGGATPMTTNGWPLRITVRPITEGSPANCRFQKLSLKTTTGWVFGVRSSSGRNPRRARDARRDVEVVAADELPEHSQRIATGSQIHRQQRERDQILDALRPPQSEVDEVRVGDAQRVASPRRPVEGDDAVGIGNAVERPPHHVLDPTVMVTLAPIPRPSVITASAVKPGLRTIIRQPYRRSWVIISRFLT